MAKDGTINISIKPGDTPDEIRVSATGQQQEWASLDTLADWGLSQDKLKWYGMKFTSEMGVGGLYPKFVACQQQRYTNVGDRFWTGTGDNVHHARGDVDAAYVELKPGESRIGKLDLKPAIIFKEIFDNRGNNTTMVCKPHIDESITETAETGWESSKSLGVSTTVGVEVGSEAAGVKAKLESTISMEASWGQSGSKSKETQVGDGVEIETMIAPGKLVVAALTAKRGTLTVQTDIIAKLLGYVDCQWWAKGHHNFFYGQPWSLVDLLTLLDAGGTGAAALERKNTMTTTFDFFAEGVAAFYPLKSTEPEVVDDTINRGGGANAVTGIRGFRTMPAGGWNLRV